jgi:titin
VLITDTSTTGNVVEGNYLGTNAAGTSAVPNAEAGVSLYPAASGNVVGGLVAGARNVISGNRDDGIDLFGPNNLIEGNYIGTNAAGSAAVPNVCDGIAAYTTISHDNLIGGTVPGARNIISGNGIPGGCGGVAFGIEIRDAVNTQVAGNYIGTSPSGGAAMGNLGGGVALDGGSHSITIGGVTPAERNVISGNRDDGVDILDTAYGNSVLGNFIGTTAIGGPLGNVNFGVYVASTGSSNLIGEPVGTGGNVIAFNGATTAADGVRIDGLNAHVSVRASNIYSNGGLGILLADDANGVQAAPQITEVKTTATSTTIDYTLASNANRTYDVDFFANAACDASGAGEGQKYLGSKTTVTDGVGNATDEVVFPTPLGALKIVTATATDESTHDTSQFSDCAKP